jgi:hypothetical protein
MELNKEILRWVLMIGAAPIWLPFILTLWNDFNDALREEGGLLGEPPSPRELEKIRREKAERPELLVNEPIIRAGDRRRPRLANRGANAAATKPGARPRRGF